MKLWHLVALFALTACTGRGLQGTRWEELEGPDGTPRYAISGPTLAACYRAAAERCSGQTYVVLDQRRQQPELSPHTAAPTAHWLLVACR